MLIWFIRTVAFSWGLGAGGEDFILPRIWGNIGRDVWLTKPEMSAASIRYGADRDVGNIPGCPAQLSTPTLPPNKESSSPKC